MTDPFTRNVLDLPLVAADVRSGASPGNVADATDEVGVGVSNLRNVAWLSRGVQLSRAVARVLVGGSEEDGVGTGFLVAEDLFVTNHHVLAEQTTAVASTVQFNFQLTWTGQLEHTKTFAITALVRTDADLDCTIVRVEGQPGKIFGWLDPSDYAEVTVDDPVFIVQHPRGEPKQIAVGDNKVTAVFGDKLQYTTDTDKGSSGSPVFNADWQLVGLHHKGGELAGQDGVTTSFINEGIRFASLVRASEGLLGSVDHLYDMVMGEMRQDVLRVLELGTDDVPGSAAQLVDLHPSLATVLSETAGSDPKRSPLLAVVISAVAAGVALMRALRHDGTSVSVVGVPPGPSLALVSVVTLVVHDDQMEGSVYANAIERIAAQPDVVADLVAAVPGVDGTTSAATTLLISISAGAAAAAP